MGDGSDEGRYPDVIASNTKVTFTRTRGQYKKPLESAINGVKSMLVNHQVVKAAITPDGFITGDIDEARGVALPDSSPGLWLVTGLYKVSLGGFMPDFEIEVTEEHTQESPLDIADYISYVAPAKTPVQTVSIPQGSDGQLMQWDSGEIVWKDTEVLAGPSNTLTIGVVESVDDTPYVGISGESPNQTLSFGLPKGDKGDIGPAGPAGAIADASSYILTGPGRPDTPATTEGIITGNEPVGAEYRSTDGAGVGAWVWMKRPNGWVVSDGDTGWRDVGEILNPEWSGSGSTVLIRRVQDVVFFEATAVRVNDQTTGNQAAISLLTATATTTGFRWRDNFSIAESGRVLNAATAATPVDIAIIVSSGSANLYASIPGKTTTPWKAGHTVRMGVSWSTTQAWPTILPGTPA